MKVWIARDTDGGLFMYDKKPRRTATFFMRVNTNESTSIWELPEAFLPGVTWENSPKEFEMVMDIFELKAQIGKGEEDGK